MATTKLVGRVQRNGDQTVERYEVTISRNEKAAVDIKAQRISRIEHVEAPGVANIRSDKKTVSIGLYPTLPAFTEDNSGVTGTEDLTPGGTYTGTEPANYTVKITGTGTPNQFQWKKDNGTFSASANITGSAQALSDGVTITFGSTTGHTLNDQWVITAFPSTSKFYVRLEGYGG
ncbi:MAG: hypothetical protein AB1489_24605 [Acidobacteriota bacterium]